ARATVVVEARERSGALITADFALEDGREVLAVPGEITSGLSAGTNALLRVGATPATGVGDVLEAIGVLPAAVEAPAPDDPAAAAVLAALAGGASTADELARSAASTPERSRPPSRCSSSPDRSWWRRGWCAVRSRDD